MQYISVLPIRTMLCLQDSFLWLALYLDKTSMAIKKAYLWGSVSLCLLALGFFFSANDWGFVRLMYTMSTRPWIVTPSEVTWRILGFRGLTLCICLDKSLFNIFFSSPKLTLISGAWSCKALLNFTGFEKLPGKEMVFQSRIIFLTSERLQTIFETEYPIPKRAN